MGINTEKLTTRLNLLKQGETLYLQHLAYGTYKVYMNPQRNRILREGICPYAIRRTTYDLVTVQTTFNGDLNGCIEDPQRGTSEKDVNYLLLWDCGRWFLQLGASALRGKPVVKEI